jgi:adenosine kinase
MNIVLTGSVAFDYLMTFPGFFRDHILPDRLDSISLSFLVTSLDRRRGGIAPNIAYSMALLGEKPTIMATVGEDFGEYRLWLESKGLQTEGMKVVPGVFTASYFCNTDQSNAQIASFYPGAMGYASQLSFHNWTGEKPDLVVISPNDPGAMRQYVSECRQLNLPYLYDPSQQIVRMTETELREGIEGAYALFVNDYEEGLVQKMTGMTNNDLLGYVDFMVVTRGSSGSTIYTKEHEYLVPIVPAEQIIDPTGVGDAFRGGFLTGYSRGLDWETCGRMGALAATYCLEQKGPQGQDYSRPEFLARYEKNFGANQKLEELLK